MNIVLLLFVITLVLQTLIANKCPQGQVKVQNKKTLTSNGCGAAGMVIQTQYDLTKACDIHDMCYSICGASKQFCEKEFEQNMKNVCKEDYKDHPQCLSQIGTFMMGVQMFGQGSYNDGQKEFCQCVDKDQKNKIYEELRLNLIKDQELSPEQIETQAKNEQKQNKKQHWKKYYELVKSFPNFIVKESKQDNSDDKFRENSNNNNQQRQKRQEYRRQNARKDL